MAFDLDQSTIEEVWSPDEQLVLDLQRRTRRKWQTISLLAGDCDTVVSPLWREIKHWTRGFLHIRLSGQNIYDNFKLIKNKKKNRLLEKALIEYNNIE